MSRPKKSVIYPKLNDCKGDLSRQWYVEYACINPQTKKLERFRIYEGFANKSDQERRNHAQSIIKEFTMRLQKGWTPFESEGESFVFVDMLDYDCFVTKIPGKKKKSMSYIHKMMNDYLISKREEIKKKSFQDQRAVLRRLFDWLEDQRLINVHPREITTVHVVDFLRYLSATYGLSRITIKKYRQVLFSLFDYLRSKGVIVANPVIDIPQIGKVVDHAPYPIPKRDRDRLTAVIKEKDPQLWLACCLMYYTAIRPGEEIRRLQIKNINMHSRKITITSPDAKNDDTETIDMPRQLYEELKKWNLEDYYPSTYLFSKHGLPGEVMLSKNNMPTRFNQIRKELKMSDNYKFYSFKHSGAEALADKGIDPWALQSHLRHKSIETTQRYTRKRLGSRNSTIKDEFPDI